MTLATFQQAFIDALCRPTAAERGMAVYRNSVARACIDALAANHPAVAARAGPALFETLAAAFVGECLPVNATLADYGAGFAAFLEHHPPAARCPDLPQLARLDRGWLEAHLAADAITADPARFATLSPAELEGLHLPLHPAARWSLLSDAALLGTWYAARGMTFQAPDTRTPWGGVLFTRPGLEVLVTRIPVGACAFLAACAAGASILAAAEDTLLADADTPLGALSAALFAAGAFQVTHTLSPMKELP